MKIRTVSPVHIGSGDVLSRMEFIVDKGRILVIDFYKLFEILDKKGKDLKAVTEEMSQKYFSLENFLAKHEISPKAVVKREIRISDELSVNSDIKEAVKLKNLPYIPGSSIKGSIRTAVLWKIVNENRDLVNMAVTNVYNLLRKEGNRKKILLKADDELQKKVFGNDPREDVFRYVKVSDSDVFSDLAVYKADVVGSSRKISVFVEAIPEGSESSFHLKVDGDSLKRLLKGNGHIRNIDTDFIFDSLKEFSKAVIESELKYKIFPEKTRKFYEELYRTSDKSVFMRVGWGCGWYSTTIGTLLASHPRFEDLRKKLGLGRNPKTGIISKYFPKTRRIASTGMPFGWVEVIP